MIILRACCPRDGMNPRVRMGDVDGRGQVRGRRSQARQSGDLSLTHRDPMPRRAPRIVERKLGQEAPQNTRSARSNGSAAGGSSSLAVNSRIYHLAASQPRNRLPDRLRASPASVRLYACR